MPTQQWEVVTRIISSNALALYRAKVPGFDAKTPEYSPLALEYHLNTLCAEGWEPVSVQPIVKGDKDDVCMFRWSGTMTNGVWTHDYLCVLRRIKPS